MLRCPPWSLPRLLPAKKFTDRTSPSSLRRTLATNCSRKKIDSFFFPRMCEVEYGFLWFCWRADLRPLLHYLFSHRTQWFLLRYRCVDSISPKWTEAWNLICESYENVATNTSICWCFLGKLPCQIEYILPKIDLFVLTVGVKYFLLSLFSGLLYFSLFLLFCPSLCFFSLSEKRYWFFKIHVYSFKEVKAK